MRQHVAAPVDDGSVASHAEADALPQLVHVIRVEGGEGDAVGAEPLRQIDGGPSFAVRHHVAEGSARVIGEWAKPPHHFHQITLANFVRGGDVETDAPFVVGDAEIAEAQAAREVAGSCRWRLRTRQFDEIMERGFRVLGVPVERRRYIARQQQVLFGDGGHLLLHRRPLDPEAEEQDRHCRDDRERGGKDVAKARLERRHPLYPASSKHKISTPRPAAGPLPKAGNPASRYFPFYTVSGHCQTNLNWPTKETSVRALSD